MNQSEQKTKLLDLIEKLKSLGEDVDELNFWLNTYDILDSEQQEQLLENLQQEVDALSK